MTREREVNVYVPVVPGTAGLGGVGSIFTALGLVTLIAVLVMVAVEVAEPTPHYAPPSTCKPFCSVYNPPTTATPGGAR